MSTEVPGNAWHLAIDLGSALEQRGVEVVLAVFGRKLSEAQRRAARRISTLSLEEFPLKVEWMEDSREDVEESGRALRALAERTEPDVVQVESYAHGALRFGVPLVVAPHTDLMSWWARRQPRPLAASFPDYQARARRGLHGAQAVVASTRWALDELTRAYGPLAHAQVIAPGCDVHKFEPARKEKLVLTASRAWDGARNLALLAQVAADLPWPVLAMSDDTRAPVPLPACETRGLRVLGERSREELSENLARASIFALPASLDPSGLSVLEAALAGCALLLGDEPALRERWEGAARFVPPDDAGALHEALTRLIGEPETCDELGMRARERALGFGSDACAEAYLALYRAL